MEQPRREWAAKVGPRRRCAVAASPEERSMPEPLKPCDMCRYTGTATFAGVSGYLLWQAANNASSMAHRAVLVGMAAGFGALSVARWNADL